MAALRTQIYLTAEQRARLDERVVAEGRPLAELIREAVDAYLADQGTLDPAKALAGTFGIAPDFTVPGRGEWAEREERALGG